MNISSYLCADITHLLRTIGRGPSAAGVCIRAARGHATGNLERITRDDDIPEEIRMRSEHTPEASHRWNGIIRYGIIASPFAQ